MPAQGSALLGLGGECYLSLTWWKSGEAAHPAPNPRCIREL